MCTGPARPSKSMCSGSALGAHCWRLIDSVINSWVPRYLCFKIPTSNYSAYYRDRFLAVQAAENDPNTVTVPHCAVCGD
ncbi:hypothetical protein J6590_029746 [Homalodisca vitripennis]|nr:hypothetical protein J6590_029746 [Homalodisca vitripennis]